AIKTAGVKYVVNLSSIGAHLPDGVGPVSGLYRAEQALNKTGVNIKHLRPAYFYTNFLSSVGLVKNAGIIGSNFGGKDLKLVLVHPDDIADVAFEELTKLNFTGNSVRYISSDEKYATEVAETIGKAINKPGLPWVTFSDADALQGMLGAGLPEEIAKNFVEMGNAVNSGKMNEDYWKHHPSKLGNVKLEDFAKTFATVYSAN
ncbi:MAG: NAD-dependent dehydratase, partial [Bacteroidetes bacterium]|nr:NAD-dependent dehydratase [Bacteroidota bacterium]